MINQDRVEKMAQHIRQIALIEFGKPLPDLCKRDQMVCIAIAVREEVMIRMSATKKSQRESKARKLYYLSLEYLPGRLSLMNILNLMMDEDIAEAMRILNLQFSEIEAYGTDPALGNGGLGRLASCFLDSIATLGYPCIGYGLLYDYGIFKQDIIYGTQIERAEPWLEARPAWFTVHTDSSTTVRYNGELKETVNNQGAPCYHLLNYDVADAQCIEMPVVGYGLNATTIPLRLFNTRLVSSNFRIESFSSGDLKAATLYTMITSVLYPSDAVLLGREFRLMQEYLLVYGALNDIFRDFFETHDDISLFKDKVQIQLNDTHPAMACAELMRMLLRDYHMTIDQAWETTSKVLNYTNHTILQEALEKWDLSTFGRILPRQLKTIQLMNQAFCDNIRKKYPNDEDLVRRVSIIHDDVIHMAKLCCHTCKHINGVASLHSELLKELIFKDFYHLYPEKFTNVTNGVTLRRWVHKCNRPLSTLLSELINSNWLINYKDLQHLNTFAKDPEVQKRFLKIKANAKLQLIDYLKKLKEEKEGTEEAIYSEFFRDTDVLYDVQIKRLHEYKRQLMNALRLIMLYDEIKSGSYIPSIKRQVIFAGKAAPSYRLMKQTIRLIVAISKMVNYDPDVNKYLRVVFLPNYNVSLAEKIIPASDLSEQISTATFEASGTSCMKFSLNGALTIGTLDGATIEMAEHIGKENFPYLFGLQKEDVLKIKAIQSYHPDQILADDAQICKAVNFLTSEKLATHPTDREAFTEIQNYLRYSDPYLTLADLRSYYDLQKQIDKDYLNKSQWAYLALMNIGGSGYFSSDRSIEEYAKNIWQLEKVPIDLKTMAEVRNLFRQNDKCYKTE